MRVVPLLTVTLAAAEVPMFPAASRATATRVWGPLATVPLSQVIEYGGLVMGVPKGALSNWNCTLATPTLSEAVADTITLPDTVLPFDGEVMAAVGGVVSEEGGSTSNASTQTPVPGCFPGFFTWITRVWAAEVRPLTA